jgi:4-hydroxybenzoate polyprenyltransferase
MSQINILIISIRPKHWVKNLFIFAPLLFSKQILDLSSVVKATLGFIVFCMVASAIYLFNDVKDREEDQKHPLKKLRPIASGELKVCTAFSVAVGLGILGLVFAFILSRNFSYIVGGYIVLQILYSLVFKHVVILDVFCVAAGFFARVVGGALAINAEISYWLIICTTGRSWQSTVLTFWTR